VNTSITNWGLNEILQRENTSARDLLELGVAQENTRAYILQHFVRRASMPVHSNSCFPRFPSPGKSSGSKNTARSKVRRLGGVQAPLHMAMAENLRLIVVASNALNPRGFLSPMSLTSPTAQR
jgi:hypothetical protein